MDGRPCARTWKAYIPTRRPRSTAAVVFALLVKTLCAQAVCWSADDTVQDDRVDFNVESQSELCLI